MSIAAPISLSPSAHLPAKSPTRSIRKRLWQTVIMLAAIWMLLIGRDMHDRFVDPSPKLSLGHDLLPSYAAGLLAREGRPRDMYDRDAISAVEFKIIDQANLNIDGRYGPWLNPPFYAWAFAPLTMLPYRQAAAVFLAFNILAFVVSLALLWRMLIPANSGTTTDWQTIILGLALVMLPLPYWQAMGHQQNTFISLLLLTSAIFCWHRGRALLAGMIAGLLFFKPQLAVAFAAILILGAGWRAFAGLAVTGIALLLITFITMPGCLYDFLHRLPPILHWLQNELPYSWGRQVTFQSFWRLIIQGQVRGETSTTVKVLWWLSSGGVAIALGLACVRFLKSDRNPMSRDRLIAAAIVSMPVIMPYYMDYDLLLLVIPAALLAREWIAWPGEITPADRWLAMAWLLFCVESHFNPGFASEVHVGKWISEHLSPVFAVRHIEQIHLNLAVPLVSVLSMLHIARSLRKNVASPVEAGFDSIPALA